jgi:hypothetical protein
VLRLENGQEVNTVSGANGTWSVTIPGSKMPAGELNDTTVTVTATDLAGNTDSYRQTFDVDTIAPAPARVTTDLGTGNQIAGIGTATSPDDYHYFSVGATGAATELVVNAIAPIAPIVGGVTVPSELALFTSSVPDGSYLVISDTDAAGNQASTLYLRNTTSEITVDLSRAGLQAFDFASIDLSALQANLTVTGAQINSLTGPDHRLAIHGGTDDAVTLVGGVDTHQTTTIDGNSFTLFTLGSGASVYVDDDISKTLSAGV